MQFKESLEATAMMHALKYALKAKFHPQSYGPALPGSKQTTAKQINPPLTQYNMQLANVRGKSGDLGELAICVKEVIVGAHA